MPMSGSDQKLTSSALGGLSGGTGFAGVVSLMPEGIVKSVLIILAPAITVIISSSWHVVSQVINARVADWLIRSEKEKLSQLYNDLPKDADSKTRDELKERLNKLTLVEAGIVEGRVKAMVSS